MSTTHFVKSIQRRPSENADTLFDINNQNLIRNFCGFKKIRVYNPHLNSVFFNEM